eukprot:GDKI01017396.1.p1 GENE.GDKI01017396.1~~GDKI01017396.1.p1  ORF type:complete len:397 (-),score=91.71 GDKI01017396.1:20-1210(-)
MGNNSGKPSAVENSALSPEEQHQLEASMPNFPQESGQNLVEDSFEQQNYTSSNFGSPQNDMSSNFCSPQNDMPAFLTSNVSMGQNFSCSTNASPGDAAMKTAYEAANHIVRERISKGNKEDINILDGLKDEDIVCVDGTYDHIHQVLEALGLPFQRVTQDQFALMPLRPDQTVYINCACEFPLHAAQKAETFVRGGGQLITTDWALKNVLEAGFPGYVRFNEMPTGDEVVQIQVRDREDDVCRGFLAETSEAEPVWWLEASSYPIQVLNTEKVKVLVASRELKERYGDDPVIIKFEHGEGTVYHMISHFYLQRAEARNKKHAQTAEAYMCEQNLSADTAERVRNITSKADTPSINYGQVQSAAASSEFVSRVVISHKQRSAQRANKTSTPMPRVEE